MNKEIWDGKWDQIKGEIRSNWAELTEDDLEQVKGDSQTLLGIIKERYGEKKEALKEDYDQWMDGLKEKLK